MDGGMIDARTDAALARLTDNEKECLRRRLRQQTAKEMALDLGVSPHAVEKRLKMARTKLGLSSSLEAARLLAASERYQQSGPQPAELPPIAGKRNARFHRQLWGVSVVILTAAALAILAQATGAGPASEPAAVARNEAAPRTGDEAMKVGDIRRLSAADMVPATPEEVRAFTETMFDTMDRDNSGFIERDEAPDKSIMITDARWEGQGPPPREWFEKQEFRPAPMEPDMTRAAFLAPYDTDSDGKVSPEEFRHRTEPQVANDGVPRRWQEQYRSSS